MVSSMTVLKAAAVVVGLVVVSGGALGAYALTGGFEEPTVDSIDVRWGEVTEDTSNIRATVVVTNPNPIGIPGIISVGFTASLNDVAIAEGEKTGLGLSTGQNEIDLVIPIDNQKIPEWWVTHINRDEQSTLSIDATVKGPFGLSVPLPSQERSFQTEILSSLGGGESQELSLFGQPVLVLGEQSAEWGEATAETTPLTFSAEVTNEHDAPISFDGMGYVVKMNNVTLGAGEDRTEFTVAPGETETLAIEAALNTGAIDDWWVSHLNADETTTLTVETYAIVDGGENDPTVALDLLELSLDLQTDLLGGGGARTSDVTTTVGGDLDFETPSVELGSLEWGEVTQDATEIRATLDIQNPNADSPLNELVDLAVSQTVAMNDIQVADGTSRVEDLPTGDASETLSVSLDNAKVPQWWAAHVNNGETSTITIDSTATIDVGVTVFEIDIAAQERQFTTDLLADMNAQRSQTIQVKGQDAATIQSTSASWGQATAQETPIDAGVTLRNERDLVEMTVSDVAYTVTMNDVTVADGTDPASVTIPPGQTATLAFTIRLDSQKMDEWWVTHIENGEETTLSVTLTATIEIGGETETVTIDFLDGDSTVTTDILGSA